MNTDPWVDPATGAPLAIPRGVVLPVLDLRADAAGMKVYVVREDEMIACVDCATSEVFSVHLTREGAQAEADKAGKSYAGWPRRVVEEWPVGE